MSEQLKVLRILNPAKFRDQDKDVEFREMEIADFQYTPVPSTGGNLVVMLGPETHHGALSDAQSQHGFIDVEVIEAIDGDPNEVQSYTGRFNMTLVEGQKVYMETSGDLKKDKESIDQIRNRQESARKETNARKVASRA